MVAQEASVEEAVNLGIAQTLCPSLHRGTECECYISHVHMQTKFISKRFSNMILNCYIRVSKSNMILYGQLMECIGGRLVVIESDSLISIQNMHNEFLTDRLRQ